MSEPRVNPSLPTYDSYQKLVSSHLQKLPTLKITGRPRVSVVTIVFNAAKTLEQTIQSVLAQTDSDFEYIIVDGGSTDGSLDIIKKYSDKLTYWLSEKDNGIADAFNKGVALCRGEMIGIMNADDWYEPGVFKRISELSVEKPDVDVFCGQTKFWNNNKPSYIYHADPEKLHLDTTIGHQAVFVRRRVYEECGLYRIDKKYASDYDFFLRLKLEGESFEVLNWVIANMRDEGVSDTQWKKVYKEVCEVQTERLKKHLQPNLRYYYKLLRTQTSRALSRAGLEPIVTIYRKYFSVLRKDRV